MSGRKKVTQQNKRFQGSLVNRESLELLLMAMKSQEASNAKFKTPDKALVYFDRIIHNNVDLY